MAKAHEQRELDRMHLVTLETAERRVAQRLASAHSEVVGVKEMLIKAAPSKRKGLLLLVVDEGWCTKCGVRSIHLHEIVNRSVAT